MKRPKKSAHVSKDGFTDRERAFAEAYILDPRPRSAAMKAGYPSSSAGNAAKAFLQNPKIVNFIEDARSELRKQYEVNRDRVVGELALLAFSNIQDYTRLVDGDLVIDMSNTPREQLAAITELTSEVYVEGRGDDAESVKKTKIKLASKREALVDLGKVLGLFDAKENDELKVVIIGGLPSDDINPTPDASPGSGSSLPAT